LAVNEFADQKKRLAIGSGFPVDVSGSRGKRAPRRREVCSRPTELWA